MLNIKTRVALGISGRSERDVTHRQVAVRSPYLTETSQYGGNGTRLPACYTSAECGVWPGYRPAGKCESTTHPFSPGPHACTSLSCNSIFPVSLAAAAPSWDTFGTTARNHSLKRTATVIQHQLSLGNSSLLSIALTNGSIVVKALGYEPEARGFETLMRWNFKFN
jgi:hypothetical protein